QPMSKATNKLSAAAVKNATTEGQAQRKLADGEGLTLVTPVSILKVWWMRHRFNGKERTSHRWASIRCIVEGRLAPDARKPSA
ncbi:MAG: Arm DNA-binding domain-containing protein, partial [Marinobacter sp.]|nr:Arm DNA-binding domain-containing protein [Marinobacter sp.]